MYFCHNLPGETGNVSLVILFIVQTDFSSNRALNNSLVLFRVISKKLCAIFKNFLSQWHCHHSLLSGFFAFCCIYLWTKGNSQFHETFAKVKSFFNDFFKCILFRIISNHCNYIFKTLSSRRNPHLPSLQIGRWICFFSFEGGLTKP